MAGLTAVSMQVRCVDAAREAARLAARGDESSDAARGVAPAGAVVEVRQDGRWVIARVSARSPLLPGLNVAAEAVAVVEPAATGG